MDGSAFVSRPGTLFAEDFDLPDAAPEPEVIEPVFSASEAGRRAGDCVARGKRRRPERSRRRRCRGDAPRGGSDRRAARGGMPGGGSASGADGRGDRRPVAGQSGRNVSRPLRALWRRRGARRRARGAARADAGAGDHGPGASRSLPQRWRRRSRGSTPIWPRMCGRSNAMPCRRAMCASPGATAARRRDAVATVAAGRRSAGARRTDAGGCSDQGRPIDAD